MDGIQYFHTATSVDEASSTGTHFFYGIERNEEGIPEQRTLTMTEYPTGPNSPPLEGVDLLTLQPILTYTIGTSTVDVYGSISQVTPTTEWSTMSGSCQRSSIQALMANLKAIHAAGKTVGPIEESSVVIGPKRALYFNCLLKAMPDGASPNRDVHDLGTFLLANCLGDPPPPSADPQLRHLLSPNGSPRRPSPSRRIIETPVF